MKTIYGVVLAVLLGSCSPFGLNPMGYEVLHEDLDVAWKKVSAMKYIAEPDGVNYYKSPKEFFNDEGGDCEDFAVALMYLLGDNTELIIIQLPSSLHALIRYKNQYLEPQIYNRFRSNDTFVISSVYEYNTVMQCCTEYGTRHL